METERDHASEKAETLRRVANELRLAGNLRQSLEAFRRALLIAPGNGWLLFEFARGLHSYAGTQKDSRLVRRAKAALRLAEERAENNAALLARIGETWFQYDETDRAEKVFRRVAAIETDNFRASNGLAEINLTAGKLAHVIHHFQASARAANDDALRGWARNEADYFARLNTNDNYLDAELARINRLHDAQTGGRTCLRLSLVGLLTALFGIVAADDLIVQIGLAIAAVTAVLWLLLIVSAKLLIPRTVPDTDEQ
jgi:tetratricopeptide (TPR) repeat protein